MATPRKRRTAAAPAPTPAVADAAQAAPASAPAPDDRPRAEPTSMWVRFTAPFDWTPPERRAVTKAYPAGYCDRVPIDCARRAIEAGKAERVRAPATASAARALVSGAAEPEALG